MAKSKQGSKNKPQPKPQDPALDETLQATTGEVIDVLTRYRTVIVAVIVGALGVVAVVGFMQKAAEAGRERLNAQWYEAFEKHDEPRSAEQLREAISVAEELIETEIGPVVAVALGAALLRSDEEGVEKSKAFTLLDRAKSAHPDDPFLTSQMSRFESARADLDFKPPVPVATEEPTGDTADDSADPMGDESMGEGDTSDAGDMAPSENAAAVEPIADPTPADPTPADPAPAGTDSATSQPADGR